jgi:hypothetical protein
VELLLLVLLLPTSFINRFFCSDVLRARTIKHPIVAQPDHYNTL